jgi:hypothetical protein
MTDGIHFSELLDYLEGENQRLKQFFSRHPQAFNLPLDILPEMRKLVLHIFEVELFFAKAAGERGKLPTARSTNCSASAKRQPTFAANSSPPPGRRAGAKLFSLMGGHGKPAAARCWRRHAMK